MVDGYFEIGESVKTVFRHIPTFESFTASQKVSKTNEGLKDFEYSYADEPDWMRKAMLDDEKNTVKGLAADLARHVKTGMKIDASGDPDYGWEKIAMGIIKDAFKKEKIKLK